MKLVLVFLLLWIVDVFADNSCNISQTPGGRVLPLLPCISSSQDWYLPWSAPLKACRHRIFYSCDFTAFEDSDEDCVCIVSNQEICRIEVIRRLRTSVLYLAVTSDQVSDYRYLRLSDPNNNFTTGVVVSTSSNLGTVLSNNYNNIEFIDTAVHSACGSTLGLFCDSFGIAALFGPAILNESTSTFHEVSPAWVNVTTIDLGTSRALNDLPSSYTLIRSLVVLVLEDSAQTTLPSWWCNWSTLKYLGLRANAFEGTLPVEFRNFTAMQEFRIHKNLGLFGTLPAAYSSWVNLEGIRLTETNVGGTLPQAYSAWSRLKRFILFSTKISGTLPSAYSSWTSLQEIHIYDTQISGTLPKEYSSWTMTISFYGDTNRLEGVLPASYSTWVRIKNFQVFNTNIRGGLPAEYSAWKSVQSFYVYSTKLSGTLPPQYSHWEGITDFRVSHNNNLSGTLPPEYSAWTNIEVFSFEKTELSGTLPAEYSVWSTVLEIRMSFTQLEGTIPPSWSSFSQLRMFDASHVPLLRGTIPEGWTPTDSLISFDVSWTSITGQIPASFSSSVLTVSFTNCSVNFASDTLFRNAICDSCFTLQHRYLPKASFITMTKSKWEVQNPVVPEGVRKLIMDDAIGLYFDSNWFENLPKSLNELSMQRCGLSGTIPLAAIEAAYVLNLQGNLFVGNLPEISRNIRLVKLNIAYNMLSGTLPSSWGKYASSLQEAIFDNNLLSGGLPSSWGNLQHLQVLRLSRLKNFTAIDVVEYPPSLQVFDVSFNAITGTFPFQLAFHPQIQELNLGHTLIQTLPPALPPRITTLIMTQVPWGYPIPRWVNNTLPSSLIYLDITPLQYVDLPTLHLSPTQLFTNSLFTVRDLGTAQTQLLNTSWPLLSLIGNTIEFSYNDILPALQALGLEEDFCVYDPVSCSSPDSRFYFDTFLCQEESVCDVPNVRFAFPPQSPSVGNFPPPALQFDIPSTLHTRLCTCPPYHTFFNKLGTLYTARIEPEPEGCQWCGKLSSFGPTPNGIFQFPETNVLFHFGVDYRVIVEVHNMTTIASDWFQVERCANVAQAGIPHSSLCAACPLNAICDGTINVYASGNVWRPNNQSSMFLSCDDSTMACWKGEKELRHGYECRQGYEGMLCSVCSAGYGKSSASCEECYSDRRVSETILVLSILGILVFFTAMSLSAASNDESRSTPDTNKHDESNKKRRKLSIVKEVVLRVRSRITPIQGLTKMALTWLFCTSILFHCKYAANMTNGLRELLGALQQISTASPTYTSSFGCIVEFPIYATFLAYSIGVIPILIVVIAMVYVVSEVIKIGSPKLWPMTLYSTVVCCGTLLYPQVVVAVIDLLQCESVTVSYWDGGGITLTKLKTDRRISCDTDSTYLSYRYCAIIMVVIVGFGFPATCAFLYRFISPEVFLFIAADVRESAWWWELSVMIRKSLLLACVTVVTKAEVQTVLFQFVCGLFLGLLMVTRPYASRAYNVMEGLSLTSCALGAVLVQFFVGYPNHQLEISAAIIAINCVVGFAFVVSFVIILRKSSTELSAQNVGDEVEGGGDEINSDGPEVARDESDTVSHESAQEPYATEK